MYNVYIYIYVYTYTYNIHVYTYICIYTQTDDNHNIILERTQRYGCIACDGLYVVYHVARIIKVVHCAAVRCDMVLHRAFRARILRKTGFGGEVRHGVTVCLVLLLVRFDIV